MFRIEKSSVNITKKFVNAGILSDLEGESAVSAGEPDERVTREEEALRITREAEALISVANQKAQAALAAANETAKGIIDSAEAESARIKSAAREEGLSAGAREAEAAYKDRMSEADRTLARVLGEIDAARDGMFGDMEDEIIDLVLETARKVIGAALEKNDEAYVGIIQKALRQMRVEGKITIRVSNDEYERFFSDGSAVFSLGDDAVTATIVNDPFLKSGDGIIESDGETVNAGVDSQMKLLSLAFRGGKGRG